MLPTKQTYTDYQTTHSPGLIGYCSTGGGGGGDAVTMAEAVVDFVVLVISGRAHPPTIILPRPATIQALDTLIPSDQNHHHSSTGKECYE
mmetsp:Transcript_34578/g.35167  ORF Transcript_34578/g.35167 Transcript_34578/m.35167 type:complete len:90 (+) Transcript_34578:536-805(+)